MTELAQIFAELSISQYLDTFIEQGFDTWETILDITESDFDALGVKLGHRRKIQRRIADSRGISTERALASPTQHTNHLDDRAGDDQSASRGKGDGKEQSGVSNGGKRKYRRHPKSDENAPERPPSAYVIFSNKIREDLKHQQLSFTDIAKRVGENWQNLPPTEKEPYETEAFAAKDKYNSALAEYKKTENFRNYQNYLADFKAKQSSIQQVAVDTEPSKRPKLENRVSNESSGNGSSSATSQAGSDTPVARKRVCSAASNSGSQWYSGQNSTSSAGPAAATNSTSPKTFSGAAGIKARTSPTAKSPRILPGYRDSLVTPLPLREVQPNADARSFSQSQPHQSIPIPQHGNSHPSVANIQVPRNRPHEHLGGSFGTASGQVPPLTHDLTVESASSGSSSVGPLYTPRTPLDLEQRQYPTIFQTKATGFFDSNQLPPLRPPSLSPQSSMLNAYHSPQGVALVMDYPVQTQAPHSLWNYQHLPSQSQMHVTSVNDSTMNQHRTHSISGYGDEGDMDPVSALIRAGEIVDRNSFNRQI